jgi:hypothetical protein
VVSIWVPLLGKVKSQGLKAIFLTWSLPRTMRAASGRLSVVESDILPSVVLWAKPRYAFNEEWSYGMRCEVGVLGRMPLAGQSGVFNCGVIFGTDSCHPPGASSVRVWFSIPHLSQSVIQKLKESLPGSYAFRFGFNGPEESPNKSLSPSPGLSHNLPPQKGKTRI